MTDGDIRPGIEAALGSLLRGRRYVRRVLHTINELMQDDETVELITTGTCSALPLLNYDSVLVLTNRRLFVLRTLLLTKLNRDIAFETVSSVQEGRKWPDWWANFFKNPEIEQIVLVASGRKVRIFVPAPDAREIVELARRHTGLPPLA